MSSQKALSIGRRAAMGRMLGLAGSIPLSLSCLGSANPAHGDTSENDTLRVEEDWYIQIGTPEPAEDSPQITTVICPSWTLWGYYAVFDMNCATQPNFESGGVQLQLWKDDAIIQSRSNADWTSLSHTDEEIRYTSAMSIHNGNLDFEIANGSSSSWGAFGHGELKLNIPTWREHLNWYGTWFTELNSRVGFASHRVRRLILERVRLYSANGLQSEDNSPRVLHSYDPQA